MPTPETRNFECVVKGFKVTGKVTAGMFEIRDYSIEATVHGYWGGTELNQLFTFDMRMVSTPPRYKVPCVRDGMLTRYLSYDRSMEAPECFEYTLNLCVDWYKEMFPELRPSTGEPSVP